MAQPQAREWYAAMLLARGEAGDVERGRELLREALAMFESIGMPLLARRVAERLAILA